MSAGLFFLRFGWVLGLLGLNARTDRAVERLSFVFFGVTGLFVLGVNKWTLAVLAGKDFIRHGYL